MIGPMMICAAKQAVAISIDSLCKSAASSLSGFGIGIGRRQRQDAGDAEERGGADAEPLVVGGSSWPVSVPLALYLS